MANEPPNPLLEKHAGPSYTVRWFSRIPLVFRQRALPTPHISPEYWQSQFKAADYATRNLVGVQEDVFMKLSLGSPDGGIPLSGYSYKNKSSATVASSKASFL